MKKINSIIEGEKNKAEMMLVITDIKFEAEHSNYKFKSVERTLMTGKQ